MEQEEEGLLVGKPKATPSAPPRHAGAPYRAPYFVSEVLFQLREICGPDVLAKGGGLHIYTTLDLALQVCMMAVRGAKGGEYTATPHLHARCRPARELTNRKLGSQERTRRRTERGARDLSPGSS